MKKIQYLTVGVAIGVVVSTLFSFVNLYNNNSSNHRMNIKNIDTEDFIDTIFHDDTTFTVIVDYPNEGLGIKLEYFSSWRNDPKVSEKLHRIYFHKNGKLESLSTYYRDTLVPTEHGLGALYETQNIGLDSAGRLVRFNLCKDFKKGWSYPEKDK